MPRQPVDPLRKKVLAYLKARDRGKAAYQASDAILAELVAELPVGQEVKLPGGRTATLTDLFADKLKVFRAHGIARYEIAVKE